MPPAQDEQELAAIEGEDGADSGTVLTASEEDAEAREEVSPEAALGETDEDEGASVTEVEVSGATDPDTDEAGPSADDAVSDELGELAIDDGVTERTEIIFVDSVAKDVVEHLSWHPGEIHVLDADRDGVEQMAEILQGRTGVDAIHVISHGSAGRLDLGTAELTVNTMADAYADELAIIRAALSEEADILLYGCDIGADEAGNAFVSALAEATGADVLASSDDTGAEALGGNWVLETHVGGNIETVTITAEEYAGVLTTAVSNGNGAVLASAGKGIYSIDLATGKATLLTTVPATVGGANTGTTQNSLAVDQANGLIYYTAEWATNTIANDALFAYDFINDQHILITDNIASYGVRLGASGLGSGGAVFANGTLYLGVENNYGGRPTGGTTAQSTQDSIYRISFSNNGRTVSSASLLVGYNAPSSQTFNAEWGDLGYDPTTNTLVSSAINGSNVSQIVRYNATTGAQVSAQTSPTGSVGQVSTDINGNIYLVTGGDTSQATIRLYNPTTNTVGPVLNITTNGTTNLTAGQIADAAGWVPPTATIGDRIFADANGDGVQNAGESGIAGVTVALYDDINNNGIVDANDRLLGTDTTNASGEYLFTGVLPGNYIVRVTDTANVLGAGAVYTTAGGDTNANADITRVGSSYLSADFGVNRPPANTVPAAQSTQEDSPLVFNAGAGNAITVADPDGGTLTTTVQVTQGTFTLGSTAGVTVAGNGTGSVTITGNATAINAALNNAYYSNTPDYHGAAQLTITTSDGRPSHADTDTVAITVTPVVDIANGSVTILPNGTVTYTANAGFVGTDTFTYTVTSGGRTETATVTVTVGANGTTITGDTSGTGTEDGGPVTGTLTTTDLDGLQANPYSVTGNPTHGTASINASGNWVYTSNADYNGPDAPDGPAEPVPWVPTTMALLSLRVFVLTSFVRGRGESAMIRV